MRSSKWLKSKITKALESSRHREDGRSEREVTMWAPQCHTAGEGLFDFILKSRF